MKNLKISTMLSVTEAKKLTVIANAVGLRNGGTATVSLNNGQWSLAAGESLHFGSQTDENAIITLDWDIDFDTSTGSVKKLQILKIENC